MSDKLLDMRDLRFILFEQLHVEDLSKHPHYADHTRDVIEMTLDASYQMAREVFWPAYVPMDRAGVQFDGKQARVHSSMHEIWKAYREAGWFGATTSVENGGQQFPYTVFLAATFIFNAANTAASMYVGQAIGAAHLLESYGSDFLKEKFMYKLYAGEWAGTMALTEPQAGSSLGDIASSAVKAKDGDHYLIQGTKRFISSGDHDLTSNIIHPTLARIEGAPAGIKGISLFVVPKYRLNPDGSAGESNNVLTGGIEHKLGIKGQATATLNYGEHGECHGWLLGEPNRGLSCMFQLMNEARIHTGLQAISQAACAYHCAVDYCRQRTQGREVTSKDPSSPQVPIIEHGDVRRMLLTQKAYIEGVSAVLLYCSYLGDREIISDSAEEKANCHALREILTPVCKAYSSDVAFESINLAMQCYGGSGYVEEYPIAQLLRDNRVFSIYEGTNNVQAMDLLGRKVAVEAGAYFRAYLAEVGKTLADAKKHPGLADLTSRVSEAMEELTQVTMHLGQIGFGGDHTLYISFATPYLRLFSQLTVSWQLLWQAEIAEAALAAATVPEERTYYESKLATARFYIHTILPTGHALAKTILETERIALDFKAEWF